MDRPALVRAELERVKAIARQAGEAGPPCRECRYSTLFGTCSNPAYYEQSFSPARGTYNIAHNTDVEAARSETGLCGPEALLWEPQSSPRAFLREIGRKMEAHPYLTALSLVGLWSALEALF